jgi:hypothetical protein
MDQRRIEFHINIAERHKIFIDFLQDCIRANHAHYPPDNFSMWLVLAAYFRAIHLLEALFAKIDKPALTSFDHYAADSRRQGFLKNFPELRKEFKSLQRLAFHVENFPEQQIADYETVSSAAAVMSVVVKGHLANIENMILNELQP